MSNFFSTKHLFTRQNFYFLLSGVGVFLAFVAFSYIVKKNHFTTFDFDMTVRLQDHISRKFDSWFSFLSDIGSFEPVTIFLLILLAIRRRLIAIFTLGLYGGMHLFEIYGKTFVSHLPPPEFMLRTQHVVVFPQFHVTLQNSYPSGHAGRAFFITTVLAVITYHTKKLSNFQKAVIFGILFVYDITMGVSRVYLGEHWTTDVIGGSILGLAFGIVGGIFIA